MQNIVIFIVVRCRTNPDLIHSLQQRRESRRIVKYCNKAGGLSDLTLRPIGVLRGNMEPLIWPNGTRSMAESVGYLIKNVGFYLLLVGTLEVLAR